MIVSIGEYRGQRTLWVHRLPAGVHTDTLNDTWLLPRKAEVCGRYSLAGNATPGCRSWRILCMSAPEEMQATTQRGALGLAPNRKQSQSPSAGGCALGVSGAKGQPHSSESHAASPSLTWGELALRTNGMEINGPAKTQTHCRRERRKHEAKDKELDL